ncbi:NAD-dependent epimerase/dehydratase family protein [uncultured Paenibacillus sp.]|uniref:NAD-dependent epimerase/dehydratase family protein n=1 Tax=uncultured Paenibacillus sp. TaxID=227322 RepID=UPI0028D33D5D|nr:NAD-dependent epimerase/dehydratase family protein [uncultured Paenibacillus sp.]
MKDQTIVVTGAAGFSGLHACAYFASAAGGGMKVVGVVRDAGHARAAEVKRTGAAVDVCELTDGEAVMRLMARHQPDYVLHLAGLNAVGPSWNVPAVFLESNLMSTVYVLEAVRKLANGCRTLVAGSMLRFEWPGGGAAPEPPHPYGLSKTMQVSAVRCWHKLYGSDALVAEPSNLIGPGPSNGLCALIADHVRALRRSRASGAPAMKPFRLSSAGERRDFLDVRDAVAAYDLLLRLGESGRVYPVASGMLRTLGEVAEAFELAADVPIEWEIGDSDAPSPQPADGSAVRALGWRPRYPFERSIADMIAAAPQPES